MDHQQTLTWHNWDRDSVDAFAPVAAIEPSSAGLCSIAQLLHGTHLGRIGESSMVAVRPFPHAEGLQWEVAGGVSLRPGAAFRDFAAVERAARAAGAAVLSFTTPHGTLARYAGRHGYRVTGWVLRNDLGAH